MHFPSDVFLGLGEELGRDPPGHSTHSHSIRASSDLLSSNPHLLLPLSLVPGRVPSFALSDTHGTKWVTVRDLGWSPHICYF